MTNSAIVGELNELRRGRGLEADDLHHRVGPLLKSAAGIGSVDAPTVVRRKLVLLLTDMSGRLPSDLRLAALIGLALDKRAQGQFLDNRIGWLATQLGRDPRTARRRVDEAFRLLSEHIASAQDQDSDNEHAPDGWFMESVEAILRADLDPPQLTEVRHLAATADHLDEIVTLVSAPKKGANDDQHRVEVQIEYGGEIIEERREVGGHLRLRIRLPRALQLGERHTYSIRFTSYPRRYMLPYYIMSAYRRCDHLLVRARFSRDYMPHSIWRLNGVPSHIVAEFVPNDDRLVLDGIGEVVLEFHQLRQGMCYGLQWLAE